MEVLKLFWNYTCLMAPYLIFGLIVAGLIHELLPDNLIERELGEKSPKAVIKAALFGVPLPLCSCSVIPLLQTLKDKEASNGALLSFLISTPYKRS